LVGEGFRVNLRQLTATAVFSKPDERSHNDRFLGAMTDKLIADLYRGLYERQWR